ncbi:MAG: FAD-dependent monooxygenase [Verrucomicrobia bacterium]|nr:FAD-dependent monooxygenase [Verrucomicrobiota bacterium]|tara:strand:+ start:419 stop:1570 length:1152 start_codon:yes stop_codon:yes gene_type:complete
MNVAVVGCGAAGAAAAVFLKRAGHDVVVFEQAPECRAVGAGFLMQPSGMDVLRELGIYEEVVSHSSKVKRLHVLEKDGRDLMELRYGELGGELFGAGLHRPVVMGALIALVEKEGIEIRWGCRVKDARKLADGWEVEGERFGLLVVADGARSAMRRAILGDGYDRGYGWGAHWFIGKNNGVFPSGDLHQVVDGTRLLAGFLPTGRERGGNEELLSLFWSLRIADDAKIRSQPLEKWKEGILDLCPRAENLLGQIDSWEQVLTARYGDVRMRKWHGDKLVFLGDAGHAMSPQLGQGVNLALADASCLVACLSEMPLEKALPEYSRRRGPVLRYYQFATRWLTPVFQSDYQFIAPFRHAGFRVSQRIPFARKLMTRSMAGMMRGI